MPFTPFHFGVGVAVHAVAPKKISFLSFCAANVLIDFEPLYYQFVIAERPYHRFFHTAAGGTAVLIATLVLFLLSRGLAYYIALPNPFNWQKLKFPAVLLGGAFGVYTHVLLDSITHKYLHPFAPLFKTYQPKFSVLEIHWFCIILGVVGGIILFVRKFRKNTSV